MEKKILNCPECSTTFDVTKDIIKMLVEYDKIESIIRKIDPFLYQQELKKQKEKNDKNRRTS